jgi:DNA polymerase III subunit delta
MEETLLYILWGEDEFSLEEALQEIKNTLGDPSLLSTNTTLLDGHKLTVNDIRSVGQAMPFLAEKRLVVVKSLLEQFEPKGKSVRSPKGNGAAQKEEESAALADCIQGLPQSTILVLMENLEIKKTPWQGNSLYKAISAQAQVKSFPNMRGIKLSQWVQSRVSQKGGSISLQATNLLMEVIGGDLYTLSNEISKLVAFSAGRLIEEKDVRMIVSASQEVDVFALADAIMERKPGAAEQILQKLLQNGTSPPQILGMMARQIQILVQVKDLKSLKRPPPEIQEKVGIFNPYAWEKISARAERYSPGRLKEIYQSLLETDLAIKTGRFDGDLALDILVADLCEKETR